ncbi:MAG TPA: hypothetical protein PK954_01130, partial [Anaerolineales bacterium]|nr:hypothetical protein [Anaerolineales bacterium]
GEVVLAKGYGFANLELSVPATPTTVYQLTVDPATGLASATSVFFDLASLPGGPAGTTITGRDLSDDDYAAPSYDRNAFAQVGTIGLGDLDLSDDGATLYVVSLEDRTLYA